MSTDLSGHRVIIVVFGMVGCGACEEYIPRLLTKSEPYQRAGIPVFVYDVASPDPNLQALADRYKIEGTPTTLVLPRGKGFLRIVGGLEDAQIDDLLQRAHAVQLGYPLR